MKSTNKPAIRFKGYNDAWEQRKVGELLIERNEQVPMSEEYPLMAFIANEGVAPKGDRYDRSSLVKDTENKTYKKTEFGDFIYSSNNLETGSIGLNKYGNACISPVYSIFQPTGISNSDFLGRRLVRKDFINAMVKWRQGVVYGQWRIHESDFLEIEILVPLVKEQRKIGTFLDYLDHLITLHQRKLEKLKNIKNSMLEKMFPKNYKDVPEIRFTGFTEAWEQRKVSEVTAFHKQGFYTTEAYDDEKKYYLLRGTDLIENKLVLKDTPKIDATEKDYQAFKTQIGDFLIVRSGTVGTYGIVYEDIPAIFGSYLIDFRFDKSLVTNEFFGYFYQSDLFKNQLRQIIQQSANTNINAENIKSTSIKLPSIPEQKKIGGFFSSLDHLITLHQRKLEKLQNIKKSCLEKMFV